MDQHNEGKRTLEDIRESLAGRTGERYWRSLDELADTQEFRAAVEKEFPSDAPVWEDAVSRRRFLHLMGASIALAGLSSCVKQPDEKILPYVKQPEYLVPGKPLSFATAFTMNGFATGVLVTSHMGRPTKIQGNPDHPASLGAADAMTMASILHLYDPDRSQVVRRDGEITTLNNFLVRLAGALDAQKGLSGRGLRILTGTVTSPTLAWQIESLLKLYPGAGWHRYDPAGHADEREGSKLAFGEYAQTVCRFDRADVVVSFDADFMSEGPARLRYSREFAARRRVRGAKADLSRMYVAEGFPTVTGSVADHRAPVRAGRIAALANRLGVLLGVAGAVPSDLSQGEEVWVAAAAEDLKAKRGASVVIAGPGQPPEVHGLVHGINEALGNVGTTITYLAPAEYGYGTPDASLKALAEQMHAGEVDLLLIAGCNPLYDAPADLDFGHALTKTGMSVSLGLYNDETARACGWHVPESHYLEAWSDARAFDGTASIVQPLIAPLYNTMSVHELLAEMAGMSGKKGYEIVREYWELRRRDAAARRGTVRDGGGAGHDFETFWRGCLSDGVVPGTASAPMVPKYRGAAAIADASRRRSERANARPNQVVNFPGSDVEVMFRPDPTVADGRFANNGWLQELPKPVTKLTWDNAAFVSVRTAEELGIGDEEIIDITVDGAKCRVPLLAQPGHPDDSVTLHLGYGRRHAGRVGNGAGSDVYPLRSTANQGWARGSIARTGLVRKLAVTQDHGAMEGRPIYRRATAAEFAADPEFARDMAHVPANDESLYPPVAYDGYKWGMSIDLNACTGCNACVIGCQSENNIPIVGRDEVLNGREMHWIRIDRYYAGGMDYPDILSQPVACMHCENAPCEPVCPVAATSHDSEGLNVMTYNRCVGTRYCSNNCPYKVRRFNFLQYSDTKTPSVQMMHNPDVTVRNRGVMEKCTYCVQRISAARIDAKKEGRDLRDGDVVTACQSACPAEAIVFGDLNDPQSAVSKAKAQPRDYGLLTELNTRPRTSYLARISNPNPKLGGREPNG